VAKFRVGPGFGQGAEVCFEGKGEGEDFFHRYLEMYGKATIVCHEHNRSQ